VGRDGEVKIVCGAQATQLVGWSRRCLWLLQGADCWFREFRSSEDEQASPALQRAIEVSPPSGRAMRRPRLFLGRPHGCRGLRGRRIAWGWARGVCRPRARRLVGAPKYARGGFNRPPNDGSKRRRRDSGRRREALPPHGGEVRRIFSFFFVMPRKKLGLLDEDARVFCFRRQRRQRVLLVLRPPLPGADGLPSFGRRGFQIRGGSLVDTRACYA